MTVRMILEVFLALALYLTAKPLMTYDSRACSACLRYCIVALVVFCWSLGYQLLVEDQGWYEPRYGPIFGKPAVSPTRHPDLLLVDGASLGYATVVLFLLWLPVVGGSLRTYGACLQRTAESMKTAERIVVLTGHGTFRRNILALMLGSLDRKWEGHSAPELLKRHTFQSDPELVWRFHKACWRVLSETRPSPCHLALARLEGTFPDRLTLITESADGLLRFAGSQNILELYGNADRARCDNCGHKEYLKGSTPALVHCGNCGNLMRPDLVWLDEDIPTDIWQAAERAIQECNCLVVVDTRSGTTPVSNLVEIAHRGGARVIEVSREEKEQGITPHIGIYGNVATIMNGLERQLDAMGIRNSLQRVWPRQRAE